MRLPMNTSLATLKPSGIRRINALAAQHPGCIALALGEPDFPTPDVISAEVTAALGRGDTHAGDSGPRHLHAHQSHGRYPRRGIARRRGTRGRASGHLRNLRRRI